MDFYYKKTQTTTAKDGNSGDRAVTYHYTTGHPNNATIVVPNQQLSSSSLKTRKSRFMGRVINSFKNTVVSTIQRVVPKRLRANRDQRQNYFYSKVNGIECNFVDTKGQIRPSLVWPLNNIHNEDDCYMEEMLDSVPKESHEVNSVSLLTNLWTKWRVKQIKSHLKLVCKEYPTLPYLMKAIIKESAPVMSSNRIFLDKYIGFDGSGVVFSAQMNDRKIGLKFSNACNVCKDITSVLLTFDDKNLVNFFGLKGNSYGYGVIGMDWIGNYDLLLSHISSLAKKSQLMDFQSIQMLAKDVMSGVLYLHSRGYAHNNIQLESILISRQPGGVCAKICGFDLISSRRNVKVKCPPISCSPEILEGVILEDPRKADVWAIGITLLIAATSHYPFYGIEGVDGKEIAQEMRVRTIGLRFNEIPNIPKSHSNEALIRVLNRLLGPNQQRRDSLETILKDKYFESKDLMSPQIRRISDKISGFLVFN